MGPLAWSADNRPRHATTAAPFEPADQAETDRVAGRLRQCADLRSAAGGRVLPGAWLGGLGDACELVEFDATHASLDLKLPPLGAYVLCGQPLHALAGGCVALDDLFGPAGRRLDERLRASRHAAGAHLSQAASPPDRGQRLLAQDSRTPLPEGSIESAQVGFRRWVP